MNIRAKLRSRNQIVVPRAIRAKLGVGPGDDLLFRVEEDCVRVERPARADDLFAAFTEWASAEDDAAYADL